MAAWRVQRFIIYRVLHMDDTPHRIALSVGIGFFVAWTPTIGLQMVLALLLCTLLRANKLIGVPLVWVSNPFTVIPIYYPNYKLGVRLAPGATSVSLADWRAMVARVFDGDYSWLDRMAGFWEFAWDISMPLWFGSIFVGVLVGGLMYWITYVGVIRYRRRFSHRRPWLTMKGRQGRPA